MKLSNGFIRRSHSKEQRTGRGMEKKTSKISKDGPMDFLLSLDIENQKNLAIYSHCPGTKLVLFGLCQGARSKSKKVRFITELRTCISRHT